MSFCESIVIPSRSIGEDSASDGRKQIAHATPTRSEWPSFDWSSNGALLVTRKV